MLLLLLLLGLLWLLNLTSHTPVFICMLKFRLPVSQLLLWLTRRQLFPCGLLPPLFILRIPQLLLLQLLLQLNPPLLLLLLLQLKPLLLLLLLLLEQQQHLQLLLHIYLLHSLSPSSHKLLTPTPTPSQFPVLHHPLCARCTVPCCLHGCRHPQLLLQQTDAHPHLLHLRLCLLLLLHHRPQRRFQLEGLWQQKNKGGRDGETSKVLAGLPHCRTTRWITETRKRRDNL